MKENTSSLGDEGGGNVCPWEAMEGSCSLSSTDDLEFVQQFAWGTVFAPQDDTL